jgi:hypothetical protein
MYVYVYFNTRTPTLKTSLKINIKPEHVTEYSTYLCILLRNRPDWPIGHVCTVPQVRFALTSHAIPLDARDDPCADKTCDVNGFCVVQDDVAKCVCQVPILPISPKSFAPEFWTFFPKKLQSYIFSTKTTKYIPNPDSISSPICSQAKTIQQHPYTTPPRQSTFK